MLDERGAFAEVGDVLGEVAATLGDECAEVQHHFEAHGIFLVQFGVGGDTFAQAGIHIFAVVSQSGEPGIVIDTSAAPLQLFIRNIQIARQLTGRSLDAVAQPDGAHMCGGEGD